MDLVLRTPDVDGLAEVVATLAGWQADDAPMQLHPGDLGWAWQAGAAALAAAVRTWSRDGEVLALGFLDSPDVFRMTVAPEVFVDDGLARAVVADLADPDRGVLPTGRVSVESPDGSGVQAVLDATGWVLDMPWSPLRRDLTAPVEDPGLRIDVVGPDLVSASTAVHRSAFGSEKYTDERWHTLSGGIPFRDARSLLGFDDRGDAVAEATVWSAGPGRPGLLEPVGVHADHHRRGYGRAISLAAAAALRDMGASSAWVCTPSERVGAVATYAAAGFERLPERLDRARPA